MRKQEDQKPMPIAGGTPNTQRLPNTQRWSGQRLTIIVIVSLLVVGGCLAYTLWVYGQLDRSRARSDLAWRAVASLLDARYRQLEQQLAARQDVRDLQEFNVILDQFRTTSQRRLQQETAIAAEDWLNAHAADLDQAEIDVLSANPPDLLPRLLELNGSQAQEQAVLRSPGGRLLDLFLEFQQPEEFRLAEW